MLSCEEEKKVERVSFVDQLQLRLLNLNGTVHVMCHRKLSGALRWRPPITSFAKNLFANT